MTLVWIWLAASLGFAGGVLAMSLLRMASPDPPTSDLRTRRRNGAFVVRRERSIPHY